MLLAMDAAAQRAGLHVGMPATKAQALVPGLIVRDADCLLMQEPSISSLSGPCSVTRRSSRPIRRTGW